MEATKDHISLETAKMLKDCGVESKNVFIEYQNSYNIIDPIKWECSFLEKDDDYINHLKYLSGTHNRHHPAYTWQEILWEYPEEFFGSGLLSGCYDINCQYDGIISYSPCSEIHTHTIVCLLQHKKYTEADLYFREHCILISK